MRLTIGELKEIIKKSIAGSQQDEAFDKDLVDDPAMDKESVHVSKERKKKIAKFLNDIGLTSKKHS